MLPIGEPNGFLNMDLAAEVDRVLRSTRIHGAGGRILVAVSGGLDSLVLLNLLRAVSPGLGLSLEIAHAEHGLRPESSRDAAFVRSLAASLGLPFHLGTLQVREHARKNNLSIEMSARELRHGFLARTARDRGIWFVALAHHADDQVELFFLRALRGAGGLGLAGMTPCSPSPADHGITLLRPLLNAAKDDLKGHAAESGIKFREDRSNACVDMQRNRIRIELLPLLRERFGLGNGEAVRRTMAICGAEHQFVMDEARAWIAGLEAGRPQVPFRELHVAVQRQCICRQLGQLGVRVDFESVERMRVAGKRITLAGGRIFSRQVCGLVREHHHITRFRAQEMVVRIKNEDAVEFGGIRIEWKLRPSTGKFMSQIGAEVFDADSVGSKVVLRHWRPGDRFQPSGMSAPVKLQDLWVNAKVPAEERGRRLVSSTSDGAVFWVEGLRISEKHKVTANTRRELVWSFQNRRTGEDSDKLAR